MQTITWNEFKKIRICVGTIIEANDFKEAVKPAYQLKVNLGVEIGVKNSSAQITDLYTKEELVGKRVLVVTNLPHKKIGPFISECLITGFYREDKKVVLASIDQEVSNGAVLE